MSGFGKTYNLTGSRLADNLTLVSLCVSVKSDSASTFMPKYVTIYSSNSGFVNNKKLEILTIVQEFFSKVKKLLPCINIRESHTHKDVSQVNATNNFPSLWASQ